MDRVLVVDEPWTPRDVGAPPKAAARERRYGQRFGTGFLSFYKSAEMTDCIVVGPDGVEYHLHSLLLAYHSEFFRRALSSDFKEGSARRVVLGFEDTGHVWPLLIDYFYTEDITLTDDNVLALFAASRELLIPAIQGYCADFAQHSLQASNALQFLSQAVQYNCDAFRQSCVQLVAQSFNSCCLKPTDGLPVEVLLDILQHPQLVVQGEEQVLAFVAGYVRRHSLEEGLVRQLYMQVRLPFLSNERLASLAADEAAQVPRDLLLAAMAARLTLIDHPERLPLPTGAVAATAAAAPHGGGISRVASFPTVDAAAAGADASASGSAAAGGSGGRSSTSGSGAASLLSSTASVGGGAAGAILATGMSLASPSSGGAASAGAAAAGGVGSMLAAVGGPLFAVPRRSYCCSIEYGLPGGSEYAAVPLEAVWEELVPSLGVRVSGDTLEGDPSSVLRTLDDAGSWFTVAAEGDPARPVWVEVVFPPNMRVVEITKYTFSHGMNIEAHMFPYGISDSSWFQMKGLTTQVSAGEGDEHPLHTLRTSDTSAKATDFVVSIDPACVRQHTWRRLRICAGEDGGPVTRLSVRQLRLYGRVEVSLLQEPTGRDVVAAWRRKKEAGAAGARAGTGGMFGLRGISVKRMGETGR